MQLAIRGKCQRYPPENAPESPQELRERAEKSKDAPYIDKSVEGVLEGLRCLTPSS